MILTRLALLPRCVICLATGPDGPALDARIRRLLNARKYPPITYVVFTPAAFSCDPDRHGLIGRVESLSDTIRDIIVNSLRWRTCKVRLHCRFKVIQLFASKRQVANLRRRLQSCFASMQSGLDAFKINRFRRKWAALRIQRAVLEFSLRPGHNLYVLAQQDFRRHL